jgi:hypothetical protein
MSETNPELALSIPETFPPSTFRFGHVEPNPALTPPLGGLDAFTGTFVGNGFNTIFRPNLGSPTSLPTPPVGPNDNLLELNLTSEQLSFLPQNLLASVPNRGEIQPDTFLGGVPYLQFIQDVTAQAINVPPNPAPPAVGIHLEPGLWMSVPATTAPAEGPTLVRMASIPHGTTICAPGTAQTIAGPPDIPAVDITPFIPPDNKITFPSQTAAQSDTWRIPQDLTPYIAAGKITQAILDDPNTVLRNAIAGQNIVSTTIISITTSPAAPLFGGGTDNIAFLLGDPAAATPNAQTAQMTATFWIETVEHIFLLPPIPLGPGREPMTIPVEVTEADRPVPTLLIDPPFPIPEPGRIIFTSTQIQYSQTVLLNFNGLLWPHVSVATLVPGSPLIIPPAGWAAFLKTVLREQHSE